MSNFWTGWSSFKDNFFSRIDTAKVYTSKVFGKINQKIKGVIGSAEPFKTEESHEKIAFKKRSESSDALFDPKFLADKIYLRVGDPKKALEIIDAVQQNDSRFNGDYKKRLECDLTAVKEHLERKMEQSDTERKVDESAEVIQPSQSYRKEVDADNSSKSEKDKKLQKWAGDQLVGLINRKDVSVEYKKKADDFKSSKITQRACHASNKKGVVSLSDQKSAPSSELPKYERNVRTVSNTAGLISDGEVIGFRSGKTHKESFLEQRSIADIALRAEGIRSIVEEGLDLEPGQVVNGLTFIGNEDGKPVFEYQPMILTMLDSNRLKATLTSRGAIKEGLKLILKGQFSKLKTIPVENEKNFLKKLNEANQKRFEGKEWKQYELFKDDVPIIVREKPAIIQNQVFSSLSKSPIERWAARKENIPGQLQMFQKMILKKPSLFDGELLKKIDAEKSTQGKLKLVQEAILKAQSTGSDEEKIVLRAFHVQLFGKDLDGKDYNEKDSAADLAIFLGIQTDYLGLSFSCQCKSGKDRTATATALKCASHAFYRIQGRYFDPSSASEKDKEIFRDFYTKSIIEFGFSNSEASIGAVRDKKSGLKIGRSVVAKKYLNLEDPALKERGLLL